MLLKVVVHGPVPVRGQSDAGPQKLPRKDISLPRQYRQKSSPVPGAMEKFLPVRNTKKFEKHCVRLRVWQNKVKHEVIKVFWNEEMFIKKQTFGKYIDFKNKLKLLHNCTGILK